MTVCTVQRVWRSQTAYRKIHTRLHCHDHKLSIQREKLNVRIFTHLETWFKLEITVKWLSRLWAAKHALFHRRTFAGVYKNRMSRSFSATGEIFEFTLWAKDKFSIRQPEEDRLQPITLVYLIKKLASAAIDTRKTSNNKQRNNKMAQNSVWRRLTRLRRLTELTSAAAVGLHVAAWRFLSAVTWQKAGARPVTSS